MDDLNYKWDHRFCNACGCMRACKANTGFGWHLFLSIITMGVWAVVWLIGRILFNHHFRCVICGKECRKQ